jgi:hypothetical protein
VTDAEKIEKLKAALAWALCELYGLQTYMERPENGDYGVECAVCMNEWFDPGDGIKLNEYRDLLNNT